MQLMYVNSTISSYAYDIIQDICILLFKVMTNFNRVKHCLNYLFYSHSVFSIKICLQLDLNI